MKNPHNIQRQNIESITFVSSLEGANSTKWDVSAVQDKSIMAWYTGTGPYKVYIGSNGGIFANTDSSYLFSYIGYATNSTAVNTIENIDLLQTTRVSNMSYMFTYCGAQKMTTLDLGDNFDTTRVTNMSHMFEGTGQKAMTTITFGDKFNTSSVSDMSYMFANCGYQSMTTLNLEPSASVTGLQRYTIFDTSLVTNMSNMFANCGYKSMTTLNLGSNFNTQNVQNMSAMFQNTGYTKLASLDLGDGFYTSSATNMSNMFNGCGQTAMTALDLGPAFTQIPTTNTNFATNCGKSGVIIYAPEAIYVNKNTFKLNSTSSTPINYTRGTINPIYRPEIKKISTALDMTTDPENPTMQIVVRATAERVENIGNIKINYQSDVSGMIAPDDVTIYIDGTRVNGLISEIEVDDEHRYTITLANLEQVSRQTGVPYKEWSGNISLQFAKGIMVDPIYGNANLSEVENSEGVMEVIEIKDPTVDRNTTDTLFADFIKPEFTYVYSEEDINKDNQTLTVVFDITDKYFNSTTIASRIDDITIAMLDNTTSNVNSIVEKTIEKVEDIYYPDSTTKVGERYKLVISNLDQGKGFDYSGPMSITIPSGIATDKSNNANSSKTITIGVNEPEGTGDSEVVDVVKPIWTVKNVNTVFENGVTKAMMDLIATDKYFSNMLVTDEQLEEQIQILDGDGVAINAPELVKELSAPTFIKWDSETETYTSNVPESEANGVKYTLSISNLEESDESFKTAIENGRIYREFSGDVKIVAPGGTIIDTSSNINEALSIDLGMIDTIKPEIMKVSSTVNTTQKTETIIFNVTDKYFDSTDSIVADEIQVYIDEELANVTKALTKNTRSADEKVGNITYKANGDIYATINSTDHLIGTQYKLVLSDFEQALENSKGYKHAI